MPVYDPMAAGVVEEPVNLKEAGHHLGPVIVNRVHPRLPGDAAEQAAGPGAEVRRLLHWLGTRDERGLQQIRALLSGESLLSLPLLARAPTDLASLESLGEMLLSSAVEA